MRIDYLEPDTVVTLEIGKREVSAVFLSIEGAGEDRLAKFAIPTHEKSTEVSWYRESAHRWNGRWVIGPSQERVKLAKVLKQ